MTIVDFQYFYVLITVRQTGNGTFPKTAVLNGMFLFLDVMIKDLLGRRGINFDISRGKTDDSIFS